MTRIEELAKEIVNYLRTNEFYKEAEELEDLIIKLYSDNEKNNAIERIIERTHVKWFGDLYIKNLDYQEWWRLLEKLRKEVKKIKRKSSNDVEGSL